MVSNFSMGMQRFGLDASRDFDFILILVNCISLVLSLSNISLICFSMLDLWTEFFYCHSEVGLDLLNILGLPD